MYLCSLARSSSQLRSNSSVESWDIVGKISSPRCNLRRDGYFFHPTVNQWPFGSSWQDHVTVYTRISVYFLNQQGSPAGHTVSFSSISGWLRKLKRNDTVKRYKSKSSRVPLSQKNHSLCEKTVHLFMWHPVKICNEHLWFQDLRLDNRSQVNRLLFLYFISFLVW